MKILFLSNLYPPNAIGGYERLCHEVASAFTLRGHRVSVLTSSYGGNEQSFPGQEIDRSLKLLAAEGNIYKPFKCSRRDLSGYNALNVETLKKKLAMERPDAVFVWNLHFFHPSLLKAVQHSGTPTFFLLTDIWLVSFLNPVFLAQYFATRVYGGAPPVRSMRMRLRQLLAVAKLQLKGPIRGHAIFPSRFMQDLHAQAWLRFTASTVIHHGVHLPAHADTEYTARDRLVSPPGLRLLCAGRIVDLKGVHTAIEALPEVISRLPDFQVRLTLLGDRQDREYMQRLSDLIRAKGLADHVEFLPAIGEDRLFALFQEHDIYLFPSIYEPFSLTLIHALASGIPTIASNAGGNPEIVRQRETGMVFPKDNAAALAQAIIALAQDAPLRQTVSAGARRAAREFSFDRMIDHIEAYIASHL